MKEYHILLPLFLLLVFLVEPTVAQQPAPTKSESVITTDSLLKLYGPNEDYKRLNAKVEEMVANVETHKKEERKERQIIFWVSLIATLAPWGMLVRVLWKNPSLLRNPSMIWHDVVILSVLTLVLFLINYAFLWMRVELGHKFHILIAFIVVISLLTMCIVGLRKRNKLKIEN